MAVKLATYSGRSQVRELDMCAQCTCSLLVLATIGGESHDSPVANTLPNEIAFSLIDETATSLRRSPEVVREALDSFPDRDLDEVLDAMQSLGTCEVSTLEAYLTSAAVLDVELDGWLDDVG